jgi:hypothetical protein
MEKNNEYLLPLHSTLDCFRPVLARADRLRIDVQNLSACSPLLGSGDAFDQVLAFSDDK